VQFPPIPEWGLPGFEITTCYGVLVAGGTPPTMVKNLRDELVQVLAQPDVKARLTRDGMTPVGSTPAEFQSFLAAETAKATRIMKAAGIKPAD
jgi:tripartite-type tricarboxylate transporter receptor subunit TctC